MNSPNNTSPLIATGTLTASVNGIDNFNAENLLLVTDGRTIAIGGIQDNENSLIRAISIDLVAEIKNGTYSFNIDREITRLFLNASGSQWYVTQSGTVTVDFDRDADRYKGSFEINAQELPNGKEINVIGTFDLEGLEPVTVKLQNPH